MNILKIRTAYARILPVKNVLSLRGVTYDNQFNQFKKIHSSQVKYSNVPKPNSANAKYSLRNYALALTIMALAASFGAVPLYGLFCQVTGFGGTTRHIIDENKLKNLTKNTKRKIKVKFNSDTAAFMQWNFKAQQSEIEVTPGETALAFYTATNPSDKPIIGISTYNVVPFEAGPYFNKIQCFCFEEQMLNPNEKVDMPVFFYIDPEYCEDPLLENVDEIVLSYTFFEAKEGFQIPLPGFLKNT